MSGRVVFITGASRGIGRACALAFAREGAQLVLNARTAEALADVHATAIAAGAPEPLLCAYDVADADGIKAAFQRVFKAHGRLDVLVNNAGRMDAALLGMMSQAVLREEIDVNLTGTILHMQAASRLMARGGGGAIVNLSSIVGRFGFEGQVAYGAAKAGVIGATLSAAKELASSQVRVNAVAPGVIETELHRGQTLQQREESLARIRMGRAGTPEEVAALVHFLASDAARYITGQVIGIDGGMSL